MKSNQFEGLNGAGLKVAVVTARFNQVLTDAMLEDCLKALETAQVAKEDIVSVRVPGSFELPIMAMAFASQKKFDVIVCMGIIIKGDTKHDHYIADGVTNGLQRIAMDHQIPVIFGVLTTENREQAEVRSVGGQKKGWEAGMSAVEMGNLMKSIR